MTAMEAVLDVAIDANVVLILSFCLWWVSQAILSRTGLRSDFRLHLKLLRTVLLVVVISPLFSTLALWASQTLWPRAPITLGDLAVAAYLRGDIAMPAVEFEAALNLRNHLTDLYFAGQIPWLSFVFGAILAGSLVLAIRMCVTMWQIRGIVADSYVWRRSKSTDIRLSDTVTIPFATRGLFRRHVVLPSALLTEPEKLRIVLAHEFEHLRQADVEWELIFEALRPFFYFNPVFHLWKRSFDRLREINCDQSVLEHLKISPREYARCLLDFCAGAASGRRGVGALNVAFTRTGSRAGRLALEARLMALMTARQARSNAPAFVAVALMLAVGIGLAAMSVKRTTDWTYDRLMLSTVVNLERLEAINRGF